MLLLYHTPAQPETEPIQDDDSNNTQVASSAMAVFTRIPPPSPSNLTTIVGTHRTRPSYPRPSSPPQTLIHSAYPLPRYRTTHTTGTLQPYPLTPTLFQSPDSPRAHLPPEVASRPVQTTHMSMTSRLHGYTWALYSDARRWRGKRRKVPHLRARSGVGSTGGQRSTVRVGVVVRWVHGGAGAVGGLGVGASGREWRRERRADRRAAEEIEVVGREEERRGGAVVVVVVNKEEGYT